MIAELKTTRTIPVRLRHYDGADTSGYRCPVARAIREALRKPAEIVICVWTDRVQIGKNIYVLPPEATFADVAWTQKRERREFDFELSNEKTTA